MKKLLIVLLLLMSANVFSADFDFLTSLEYVKKYLDENNIQYYMHTYPDTEKYKYENDYTIEYDTILLNTEGRITLYFDQDNGMTSYMYMIQNIDLSSLKEDLLYKYGSPIDEQKDRLSWDLDYMYIILSFSGSDNINTTALSYIYQDTTE